MPNQPHTNGTRFLQSGDQKPERGYQADGLQGEESLTRRVEALALNPGARHRDIADTMQMYKQGMLFNVPRMTTWSALAMISKKHDRQGLEVGHAGSHEAHRGRAQETWSSDGALCFWNMKPDTLRRLCVMVHEKKHGRTSGWWSAKCGAPDVDKNDITVVSVRIGEDDNQVFFFRAKALRGGVVVSKTHEAQFAQVLQVQTTSVSVAILAQATACPVGLCFLFSGGRTLCGRAPWTLVAPCQLQAALPGFWSRRS